MADRAVHDVIVVGCGMAGIAAAHALSEFDVQVLEREPRPGGRVKTVASGGGTVDLGACLAFDVRLLPEGSTPPGVCLRERGPLGLQLGSQRAFADSAWGAVEGLSLPEPALRALRALRNRRLGFDELPEQAAAVARALFQQIHPGDMSAYTVLRQGDAWLDWYPDHWAGGNGRLVDAYLERVRAQLTLRATVTRLQAGSGEVVVDYVQSGVAHQTSARAVVVATPATVARELVTPEDPESAAFLQQIHYGRYTVVAFALGGPIEQFRVLVTPGAAFALALQQRGPAPDVIGLICYYDDARSDFADARDDEALATATAQELARLGLVDLDLRHTPWWVQRWPVSGTILDDAHAAVTRTGFLRASQRVFLAGDYLAPTRGWGYGLADAVASGRITGAYVAEQLEREL